MKNKTEENFWRECFLFASSLHNSATKPTVFDDSGEPLLLDKYNFIEYCARYADMCLEEFRSFKQKQEQNANKI